MVTRLHAMQKVRGSKYIIDKNACILNGLLSGALVLTQHPMGGLFSLLAHLMRDILRDGHATIQTTYKKSHWLGGVMIWTWFNPSRSVEFENRTKWIPSFNSMNFSVACLFSSSPTNSVNGKKCKALSSVIPTPSGIRGVPQDSFAEGFLISNIGGSLNHTCVKMFVVIASSYLAGIRSGSAPCVDL
jgi:hypothetical protein